VAAELSSPALAAVRGLLAPFSDDEVRRLYWLKLTWIAERHLVPPGQPCPDHQACRRLAFALWLRSTGRLSSTAQPPDVGGDDPTGDAAIPTERSTPCCE